MDRFRSKSYNMLSHVPMDDRFVLKPIVVGPVVLLGKEFIAVGSDMDAAFLRIAR